MRPLIVSMSVSLDGVVEAPHEWSLDYQCAETLAESLALLRSCDALLLGRVTYEELAAVWPSRTDDATGFAERMNALPKYVVSRTLRSARWANTTIIADEAAEAVPALKEQPGGPILAYGSPTLTRSLIAADLVDELRLLLAPVVTGHGKRLFPDGSHPTRLRLAGAAGHRGGMASLRLAPATVPTAA